MGSEGRRARYSNVLSPMAQFTGLELDLIDILTGVWLECYDYYRVRRSDTVADYYAAASINVDTKAMLPAAEAPGDRLPPMQVRQT